MSIAETFAFRRLCATIGAMTPRLQSSLMNIGLLLGSILLVIAALEIGLRVAGIDQGHTVPPPLYRKSSNPNISYELKPNLNIHVFRSTVQTDASGLRSPQADPAKPTLAVLGDSITFGYGLEESQSIPGRLQEMLPAWNVVNAAVPGYNLLQEAGLYQEKVAALQPKALVLIFYWNDLHDMVPADLAPDGNLYTRGSTPPSQVCAPATIGILSMIPGKCWLDTHSALYRVLKKFALARFIKENQQQQIANERADLFSDSIDQKSVDAYAAELKAFAATLPPTLPRLFVIWPEQPLHFLLRPQMKAIAQAQGFKVLDFYEIFGNAPETLSWDTVHPDAKTDSEAADVIKAVLDHEKMLQQ